MLVPEKEIIEEIMVVMGDQVVSNLPPGWDGERLRRQSSTGNTGDPSVYGGESAGSQSAGGAAGGHGGNGASYSGRSSRPGGGSVSGSVSSSRLGSRRHGRDHEDELASLGSVNSGPSTGHGSTVSSAVMSRAQSVPDDQGNHLH